MAKVIVGLSGGVDSAVTALLLKHAGHDVTGVFMQNWAPDNDDPDCSAEQDLSDAHTIANQIGIPFEVVDFSKEYWDQVFTHCLDEFASGRTPNPDVLCNQKIKFKRFLDYALKKGADYLATGHYASIEQENDRYQLLMGEDPNKDQSYFLYLLDQFALSKSLFPLGHYHKTEIRNIAHEHGLVTADKKDSTGICFIGERKFKHFLNDYLMTKPGEIQTTDGRCLGLHDGLSFYTIGQRKGLNIGGVNTESEGAWYVLDKDLANNILIVGQGEDNPMLFKTIIQAKQPHWIDRPPMSFPFECHAKTRYRQKNQPCTIMGIDDGLVEVHFEAPQRAITPGQSIVFYEMDYNCPNEYENENRNKNEDQSVNKNEINNNKHRCLGGAIIL